MRRPTHRPLLSSETPTCSTASSRTTTRAARANRARPWSFVVPAHAGAEEILIGSSARHGAEEPILECVRPARGCQPSDRYAVAGDLDLFACPDLIEKTENLRLNL